METLEYWKSKAEHYRSLNHRQRDMIREYRGALETLHSEARSYKCRTELRSFVVETVEKVRKM